MLHPKTRPAAPAVPTRSPRRAINGKERCRPEVANTAPRSEINAAAAIPATIEEFQRPENKGRAYFKSPYEPRRGCAGDRRPLHAPDSFDHRAASYNHPEVYL